jgi:hypothetical protein
MEWNRYENPLNLSPKIKSIDIKKSMMLFMKDIDATLRYV